MLWLSSQASTAGHIWSLRRCYPHASAGSFVLKGREFLSTHFCSYRCAEATASAVSRQVSTPLEQEQPDWEPGLGRCRAEPHLLPVCTLSELAESMFPRLGPYPWHHSQRGLWCVNQKSGVSTNPHWARHASRDTGFTWASCLWSERLPGSFLLREKAKELKLVFMSYSVRGRQSVPATPCRWRHSCSLVKPGQLCQTT